MTNNMNMAGKANVPSLREPITDKNRNEWRAFVDTYHAYEMAFGEDELSVETCIHVSVLRSMSRLLLTRGVKTKAEAMGKMTISQLNGVVEKIWAKTSIEDVYAGIMQRRMTRRTSPATHYDDCQRYVNDVTFFLDDQTLQFSDVHKKAIVETVLEGTLPPSFRERVKRRHNGSSDAYDLLDVILVQASEEEELTRRADEIRAGFNKMKKDQEKKKSAIGASVPQKTVEDTPKKDAEEKAGVMTRSQSTKSDKTCETCGRKGHTSRHCWKEILCESCGKTGHPTARCYHRAGSERSLGEMNIMERVLDQDLVEEDKGPDGWFRPGELNDEED